MNAPGSRTDFLPTIWSCFSDCDQSGARERPLPRILYCNSDVILRLAAEGSQQPL